MSKFAIFLSIVVVIAAGGYMVFPSTNAVKDSSGINKSELKNDRERASPDHGTFEKRFQPTAP